MKPIVITIILMVGVCFFTTGCQQKQDREKAAKEKEWPYTVVAIRDCPEDFLAELEEKKVNPFQMSYMDGEYLYIARGYGEQATGGYSIAVHGLYERGDAQLCLKTELKGPGKEETVKQKASYPYVIVKTEKTDREVLFEG